MNAIPEGALRRVLEASGASPGTPIRSRSAAVYRVPEGCLKILRAPGGAEPDEVEGSVEAAVFFYETAREHGLPVPRLLGHGSVDGWSWLLREWCDGDAGVRDARALGCHLGETLGQLHAIPVGGVGTLRAGRWQATNWGRFTADTVDRYFRDAPGAAREAMARHVKACRAFVGPRLLHSDVGLDNLVWQGDRVTALIDPGWCIGGDPLLDVSYVELSRDPEFVDGFRAGYPGYDGLDAARLRDYAVYHHVAKLLHRIEQGDPPRIAEWEARLAAVLR